MATSAQSSGGIDLIPGYQHRLTAGEIGEWNQWGRLRKVLLGTWEHTRWPWFNDGGLPENLDYIADDRRAVMIDNGGKLMSDTDPKLLAALQGEIAALRSTLEGFGVETHTLRAPTAQEVAMSSFAGGGFVQGYAAEPFWLLGNHLVENMWRSPQGHQSYKWSARDLVQPWIDADPAVRHHCPPFTKPVERIGVDGDYYYEGGDVEKVGDGNVLVAVERHSTNDRGAEWLRRLLEDDGFKVTIVHLNDTGILHLYAVLCLAGPGLAIAYKPSFPGGVLPAPIDDWDVIWLDDDEAQAMGACNIMVDRTHMIIPSACPRLADELAQHGVTAVPVDITNHAPFGGGLRCLAGVIHREID